MAIFRIANTSPNRYCDFCLLRVMLTLRSSFGIRFVILTINGVRLYGAKTFKGIISGFALSEQSYPRTPSKIGGRIETWLIAVVSVFLSYQLHSVKVSNRLSQEINPFVNFRFSFGRLVNLIFILGKPKIYSGSCESRLLDTSKLFYCHISWLSGSV